MCSEEPAEGRKMGERGEAQSRPESCRTVTIEFYWRSLGRETRSANVPRSSFALNEQAVPPSRQAVDIALRDVRKGNPEGRVEGIQLMRVKPERRLKLINLEASKQ